MFAKFLASVGLVVVAYGAFAGSVLSNINPVAHPKILAIITGAGIVITAIGAAVNAIANYQAAEHAQESAMAKQVPHAP